MLQNNGGQFYIGVVEDRADPLMLGRVRVRVVGLHFYDKTVLPTEDLPWAMLMQPIAGGTTMAAVGPAEGTTVIVIFNDYPQNQQPIVIGALSGIPQGEPVYIDKFEETPLFKDDITPAGRTIPTTPAEVNANHAGPLAPDTPNPSLASIIQQSQTTSSTTPLGVIQNVLGQTAQTAGAVGGILSAVGGVGSTYGTTKNAFESLLLGSGNIDSAIGQFVTLATQSGPLGSAIGAALNGRASLQDLASSVGISLDNIQSSFNSITSVSIKSPSDLLGVISNAEQIAGQITSTANSVLGVLGAIEGELSQATLEGTLTGLAGSVGAAVDSVTSEIGSIVGVGISNAQRVADFFGVDVTLPGQGGIVEILETPDAVAAVLNGPYASEKALEVNAGNIAVTQQIEIEDLTSQDFNTVPEGSTPPVSGSYGGPNYGGASPVLEKPTVDMSRYEGGSTSQIVTTPPPDWKGNRAKAEQGIKALLAAASKYGLTTNEQKCALLGIVGGECNWIPQEESAQYSSADRLCQIFQSTFKGKLDLAQQYCNWERGKKGTKAEFFNFVYDPANNGRQLGNSKPGDGGKFYGRGFIQLTGRANYERYAQLSGHPIDKNPDLLNNDISVSAEIAVLYLLDRVKGAVPTAHPQYFYAAKKSVGNNSPDIAARKLSYYEYFYGTKTPEGFGYADKQAGNTQSPYSYQGAVSGNESGLPKTQGFRDPHGKYPLKRHQNEQETNRLARGVIKETVVALKESQRTINVPIALSGGSFSQPNVPYGAKYPFNQVRETESGHVQEFDDTPGYERVHTYHRSGTFEEVDASGTKVTKIVGDGYTIYDRNGFIAIAGSANVTVNGNVNIYCRSDANIEVEGSAEMKVRGNFDIGVARDMNIAVEGNFSLWANGSMNLQSRKKGHILTTEDDLHIATNKRMHLRSVGDMFVTSESNHHTLVSNNQYSLALNQLHMKSGQDAHLTSSSNVNIVASNTAYVTAGSTASIKAGNRVDIDGRITNLNSGTASSGARAADANPSVKALVHGMVPPALGVPIYPNVEPLPGIPTLGEETFMYEIPEEGRTQVSQSYIKEQRAQNGVPNTSPGGEAKGTGGQDVPVVAPKQDEILASSQFSADYKLSKHFTLGMMFDGGFNVRHRLVAQNGLTPQQIVSNLATLCENVLEKYLEFLPDNIQGYGKRWLITSGFRMGTNKSDHSRGRAVDIQLVGRNKPAHFALIQQLDKAVPFDQLILEYAGQHSVWIHTSIKSGTFGGGSNRKMSFTMVDHKTYGQGYILLG